jgi:hypothetical protein
MALATVVFPEPVPPAIPITIGFFLSAIKKLYLRKLLISI